MRDSHLPAFLAGSLLALTALVLGVGPVAAQRGRPWNPAEAHPGPAPLDPFPAGPVVSQAVSYNVILFRIREPREDPSRAFAELARKMVPELRIGNEDPGAPSGGPRVQAVNVDVQPPDRESIESGSHQVDAEDRESVRRCRRAFAINFLAKPAGWLPKLRRIQRLIHGLAVRTGGLIWDSQSRELFTAASFATWRLAGWAGDRPLIARHLSLRRPHPDESPRITSRGMAAFGLPDVLAAGMSGPGRSQAESLLMLVADALVANPRLDRTGELTARPSACRDPDVRRRVKRDALDRTLRFKVRVGERAAVDRNRLIEVLSADGWEAVLRPFHGDRGAP